MSSILNATAVLALLLALSACGQKGPLYLPSSPPGGAAAGSATAVPDDATDASRQKGEPGSTR